MKKILLLGIVGLLSIGISVSALTLFSERANEYEKIFFDTYKGTTKQNLKLLDYFISRKVNPQKLPSLGSAPTGAMTLVASSTIKATVGSTSPVTLFSRNDGCASRIITTYAVPIMLTFATSTDLSATVKPTATFGHLQTASTTVAYDAGIYGCGVWQAYGYEFSPTVASTTISLSEFKDFR